VRLKVILTEHGEQAVDDDGIVWRDRDGQWEPTGEIGRPVNAYPVRRASMAPTQNTYAITLPKALGERWVGVKMIAEEVEGGILLRATQRPTAHEVAALA
jgi:hypothetical protein